MWLLTRPLGADEQYREPAFLQARRRHQQAQRCSLPDGVWGGPAGRDLAAWPGLPYVLLFLEWEARYPPEWTQHAKAWGTKQSLIREVARARHEEAVRAKLTDLVEIVVQRAYRCKDREYVRVARARRATTAGGGSGGCAGRGGWAGGAGKGAGGDGTGSGKAVGLGGLGGARARWLRPLLRRRRGSRW